MAIAQDETGSRASAAPVLSLYFEAGARPDAQAIHALAGKAGGFAVSHDPGADAPAGSGGNWLELLANGLSFDLRGLAPGAASAVERPVHCFDMAEAPARGWGEPLALVPGPHLAGGEAMLPVVRSLLWLAGRLFALPGLAGVGWGPARSLLSPSYFARHVVPWLEGGAFPGLGLTALIGSPDGGLQSDGLAFFIGQELRIEPELAGEGAAGARLALRLIHDLVEAGGPGEAESLTGMQGESLRLEHSRNGRFIRVRPA